MFSNLINDFSDADTINVITFKGEHTLISYADKFTIVLLDHKGGVELNFNSHQIDGVFILFLCPNEVLEISGYTELMTISFTEESRLKKVEGFSYVYGNIHKIFDLPENIYDELKILMGRIDVLLLKRPNTWCEKAINILMEVFRLSPTFTGKPNVNDYPLLYDFICLVHEHYTMHHEMSHYSKLLGTPSKRITEKFNALDIMSPHAFIKQRIIIEVKRQLLYTDKPIKTICFDVGFNDPAYFSRFFKKNTGMTTQEFRSNTSLTKY